MKRKICHLSTIHLAYDDRIFYKECVSLAAAGYDVSLVIINDGDSVVDGVKIVGLKEFKSRFVRFIRGSIIAYLKARRTGSELFHFHDPELIPVGLLFKLSGKKVIYDSHEDVPMQIFSKTWIPSRIMRKAVSWLFDRFEKWCVSFFDAVISVTPEIVAKFDDRKSFLIRNLPILEFASDDKIKVTRSRNPVLIYAGGLTRIRGIKESIEALQYLDVPVELWLLGTWENEFYKDECMNLPGASSVKYLGFKKLEEVFGYVKSADIGLVILYPEKNHLISLPAKTFEYMACGLPLIMSDIPYWKTIYKECALFVNPLDPKDISQKIMLLIHDEKLAGSLGEKGKEQVFAKYSWKNESRKLIAVYKKILGED